MSETAPSGDQRTISEDASYEELVRQLEQSVDRLESGELSLEDAVLEYEFGMQIIQRCNHMLDTAELRVTELSTRAQQSEAEISEDR
ncbi:MAG: exodeoxyribonuclease VII small subunit [Thermomicrobiaceae bacterium]